MNSASYKELVTKLGKSATDNAPRTDSDAVESSLEPPTKHLKSVLGDSMDFIDGNFSVQMLKKWIT